ncbi:MAG: hypothetical protein U0838_12055 [Chloroflexota bacterium]
MTDKTSPEAAASPFGGIKIDFGSGGASPFGGLSIVGDDGGSAARRRAGDGRRGRPRSRPRC